MSSDVYYYLIYTCAHTHIYTLTHYKHMPFKVFVSVVIIFGIKAFRRNYYEL